MSGLPIQRSGDTLYMSSTLIEVMLFIPCYPLFCVKGGHWVSRILNFFTPVLYFNSFQLTENVARVSQNVEVTCAEELQKDILRSSTEDNQPETFIWNFSVRTSHQVTLQSVGGGGRGVARLFIMRGRQGGSGVSGGGGGWRDSKWRLSLDLCTKCNFIWGLEEGRVSVRGRSPPVPLWLRHWGCISLLNVW